MEDYIDSGVIKFDWESYATHGAKAPLNASHRCDRCGAQAYMVAGKLDLGILLFCSHHGRKMKAGLINDGFEVLEFEVKI
jgi:hypothetical protein